MAGVSTRRDSEELHTLTNALRSSCSVLLTAEENNWLETAISLVYLDILTVKYNDQRCKSNILSLQRFITSQTAAACMSNAFGSGFLIVHWNQQNTNRQPATMDCGFAEVLCHGASANHHMDHENYLGASPSSVMRTILFGHTL